MTVEQVEHDEALGPSMRDHNLSMIKKEKVARHSRASRFIEYTVAVSILNENSAFLEVS